MTELEQLTQLCIRLGAPPAQAATMAAQLLKRAGQLAVERGIDPEAALQGLIEVMVKGRAGEVPPLPPSSPGAR
jgi:pyrroline-5-carboxylate reductase